MPPRREIPTPDDLLTSITNSITANSQALRDQSTKLDVLIAQLAAHFEQNQTLIATLTKLDTSSSSTPNQQPPPPSPPPPPHGFTLRPPKLSLPMFDGSNPLDWLFQADQYFSFYNISPPQRLSMVSFSLTGDALSWYKYLHNNHLFTTSENFTKCLETRFGPSSYDNHQASLFKLRQTATVTGYVTEFERLSNCVIGLPPEALLNCFLSGLQKDIQQELSILKPSSFQQAVGLAKLIEDKADDQRFRPKPVPPYHNSPTPTNPPSNPIPNTSPPLLPTPLAPTQNLSFTRLSPEAIQKRHATGLCFRCPEKFHPGHKCNPPQFLFVADNRDEHPPLIDLPDFVNTTGHPDLEDKVNFDGRDNDTVQNMETRPNQVKHVPARLLD